MSFFNIINSIFLIYVLIFSNYVIFAQGVWVNGSELPAQGVWVNGSELPAQGVVWVNGSELPVFQLKECPVTHIWDTDTQDCEIHWNSIYVGMPINIFVFAAVIVGSILLIKRFRQSSALPKKF